MSFFQHLFGLEGEPLPDNLLGPRAETTRSSATGRSGRGPARAQPSAVAVAPRTAAGGPVFTIGPTPRYGNQRSSQRSAGREESFVVRLVVEVGRPGAPCIGRPCRSGDRPRFAGSGQVPDPDLAAGKARRRGPMAEAVVGFLVPGAVKSSRSPTVK